MWTIIINTIAYNTIKFYSVLQIFIKKNIFIPSFNFISYKPNYFTLLNSQLNQTNNNNFGYEFLSICFEHNNSKKELNTKYNNLNVITFNKKENDFKAIIKFFDQDGHFKEIDLFKQYILIKNNSYVIKKLN